MVCEDDMEVCAYKYPNRIWQFCENVVYWYVFLVLWYRALEKLMSSYIAPLEVALEHSHDHRVRTNFQQNGAVTGRFSSIDPNMQAIPVRSSFADSVRSMFVPRPGWKIMSVDYSQMELRLMAALSREPALVEAYKLNQDAHRKTAMLLFGHNSIDEVCSQHSKQLMSICCHV